MDERTVITFRAADAEERIARFVEHHKGMAAVQDLGTLDGLRRYRVDAAQWSAYVRAVSTR